MDLGIRDKVAIVGGASGGIGSAIAHELGREGAHLVLWARKGEPLEQAASKIVESTGADVLTVTGDIREGADLENIVSAGMNRFGRVDILVNNDGAPRLGPLL
ncbi:MAG: SDR family NAD(P)-dependent oxidoreductase, partial [Proteobacteria bacterium]